MKDENYWIDKFNALPIEVREIFVAMNIINRKRSFVDERGRLTESYRNQTKYIDSAIGYQEEALERLKKDTQ